MIELNEEIVSVFGGGRCACMNMAYGDNVDYNMTKRCYEKMHAMKNPDKFFCGGEFTVYWLGNTSKSGCVDKCCDDIGSRYGVFGVDHFIIRCIDKEL